MEINKLKITAPIAHFKVPYASKLQITYDVPPLSTVIGMLKVIFGDDIDDFKFGYLFESEGKFKDAITLHKFNKKNKNKKITDCGVREYLDNCRLLIYTDLDKPIEMNHILTMGRSNCLARLHFPIEKVQLTNKEGKGYNQYTPVDIGTGVIKPISILNRYNPAVGSFDTTVKHLRFNKEFKYDKHYDIEENQNVILWHFKGGGVSVC